MSTILKALRRLEEERQTGARDLRDQVVARPRGGDSRPRFPLLVAAGAIGAVAVVGAFVYLDQQPAPSIDVATPAPRSELPPPAVAELEMPEPASFVEPALPAAPRAEAYVAAPRPEGRVTRVSTMPSNPRPSPPARPTARPRPVPAAAALPAVASPPAAEVEPLPVAASAPAPAPEVVPPVAPAPAAAEAPRKIPGIVGQPEVARRAPLPAMVVQRTLWHPTNERRVAFLRVEGREGTLELREGDAVGDAVVKQIDPSAVVFLHRGVEIRRRIGSGG